MDRILVLDDNQAVLNYLLVSLTQTEKFEVDILSDSTKSYEKIDSGNYDIILLDMDMPEVTGWEVLQWVRQNHPEIEVVILTGVEDVKLAVESMKIGAYDYLCKPVDITRLLITLERALERSRLRGELSDLRDQVKLDGIRHKEAFKDIITQSKSFLRILQKVEQIAESENTVLIWGESGTGKEMVAKAIHRVSRRRDKPIVAVNAGVFASELFASEFFGHEKGAFTGAVTSRHGFFEEAQGGTLFLDEIGELELPIQAKLLRVLQEREYFRVGSTERRGVDVRIIASTNKDLNVEIEKGRFRRDLYYRLNISSIFLPPLKERRGDTELLAYHFLEKYNRINNKKIEIISKEVMNILEAYDYPGNVRELENIIAGAVVLENSNSLSKRSLPPYLLKTVTHHQAPYSANIRKPLAKVEAEHIQQVLEYTGGNRTQAAQLLGISRVGLLKKLRDYGIDVIPPTRGGGRQQRKNPPADKTKKNG